eukprot:RCo000767
MRCSLRSACSSWETGVYSPMHGLLPLPFSPDSGGSSELPPCSLCDHPSPAEAAELDCLSGLLSGEDSCIAVSQAPQPVKSPGSRELSGERAALRLLAKESPGQVQLPLLPISIPLSPPSPSPRPHGSPCPAAPAPAVPLPPCPSSPPT